MSETQFEDIIYEKADGAFWVLPVCAVTAACTVLHMYLYDTYKELYLRMTRLDGGGESDSTAVAR